IPVDLTKKDTQKEVLRAVKSTYMNFRKGSQYAVKIATMAQNETQAFENFMGAYEKIVAAVPGGAPNVRSLQIKCAESTSLPVYDAEEDGLVEEEEEETEDEEDQEEQ
ncbi:uncharacterized protein BYT42DRAFT_498217, partial [Radiomyces spectabilis]|uniref:uncharacterized protein n=1 Tax=Radiomyces spectabilis TaxID=64574 RepID=UPI00221F6ACF